MPPTDDLSEDAMLQLAMELSMQAEHMVQPAKPDDEAEKAEKAEADNMQVDSAPAAAEPEKAAASEEPAAPATPEPQPATAPAEAGPAEGEKKKKKKKKKKKRYADLMADMGIGQTKSVEDDRAAQQERLKNVVGGGQFSKLDKI